MNDRRLNSRPGKLSAALFVSGVLLVSAAGGFLVYRLSVPAVRARADSAPPASGASLAEASANGTTGRGAAESPAAPKIPEQLPDIALPGLDGVTRHLTQWKDRPLLINFWATWCEPCRREIPLLKALRQERSADGLEVLGIAVDSRDAARQYANAHGIDYPVLIGEQGGLAAVSAFGMDTVLPFSVFADRRGRILTLKVGELHRDEAELILDRLGSVDSGSLSLARAREEVSAGVQRLTVARAAAARTARAGTQR